MQIRKRIPKQKFCHSFKSAFQQVNSVQETQILYGLFNATVINSAVQLYNQLESASLLILKYLSVLLIFNLLTAAHDCTRHIEN
mgnify:CR=1